MSGRGKSPAPGTSVFRLKLLRGKSREAAGRNSSLLANSDDRTQVLLARDRDFGAQTRPLLAAQATVDRSVGSASSGGFSILSYLTRLSSPFGIRIHNGLVRQSLSCGIVTPVKPE